MGVGAGCHPCFAGFEQCGVGAVFGEQDSCQSEAENGRKEGVQVTEPEVHAFFAKNTPGSGVK